MLTAVFPQMPPPTAVDGATFQAADNAPPPKNDTESCAAPPTGRGEEITDCPRRRHQRRVMLCPDSMLNACTSMF